MNDDDRMDGPTRRAANLPTRWIAFFRVAEDPRPVLARDAFLKLHRECAQDARRDTEGGKAVGGHGDVHGDGWLELLPGRQRRPRTRSRDRGYDHAQPAPGRVGIMELNKEIRGMRKVPEPTGDETLNVGEDVLRQSRR